MDRRRWGISKHITDFDTRLRTFTAEIGYACGELPAPVLARQLYQALRAERTAATRRGNLEATIREIEAEVEDARLVVAQREARLQELLAQAGVSVPGELNPVIVRDGERRRLEERQESLEQEVARGAECLAREQLAAEAASVDPDTLEARLQTLARELSELQITRDRLRDQRQALQIELARREAGGGAAQASQDDGQEVLVEGMSEGTRDQLYLALRLATLEQHLESGEPMPFIVDDILVALEVLAQLAAKTQVLVFTHHSRVAELAAKVPSKAGVFVHRLGG